MYTSVASYDMVFQQSNNCNTKDSTWVIIIVRNTCQPKLFNRRNIHIFIYIHGYIFFLQKLKMLECQINSNKMSKVQKES